MTSLVLGMNLAILGRTVIRGTLYSNLSQCLIAFWEKWQFLTAITSIRYGYLNSGQ